MHVRRAEAQAHLLVRATADDPVPPGWEAHPVGLEELTLAYLREPARRRCPARPAGRRRTASVGGDAMTALTVPARPDEDASLPPVPWRRMAWVTWRQHRIALAGVVAFLGVLAVFCGSPGCKLHHAYAAVTAVPSGELACLRGSDQRLHGTNDVLANGFCCRRCPR